MTNDLIDAAELGDEARRFLESKLGAAIIFEAEEQIEAAVQGLKSVDPDDPKSVRMLQNQIWLGERFKGWLLEIVTKGENALEVFKHESQE